MVTPSERFIATTICMRFTIAFSSRIWFFVIFLLVVFLFFGTTNTFKPIQLTQPGPFFNPEASCPVWQRRSTVRMVERPSFVPSKDRKHKLEKVMARASVPVYKGAFKGRGINYLITRQRSA